jgi:replicative DNA helicase
MYYAYSDRLSVDLFHNKDYQAIFQAIKLIATEGKEIDIISIVDKLRNTGVFKMPGHENIITTVSALNDPVGVKDYLLEGHIDIAHDIRKRRKLFELGQIIREKCHEMKEPDKVMDYINDVLVDLNSFSDKEFDAAEAVQATIDEINDFSNKGYVKTGIKDLDDFIFGFQYTDLVIIGGASSMGKTAFALRLFLNFLLDGQKPMFFSLEMGKTQLIQRLLGMMGEIHLSSIRHRKFNTWTKERLYESAQELAKHQFVIDDKTENLEQIISKIRKHHIKHGGKVFIVDYLQLVSVSIKGKTTREQEIAKITRTFKQLARILDIIIIPLSQMNRQSSQRTNKRPILSDLRESGAIEQDADFVLFPYRPAYYKVHEEQIPFRESAELIIAKGRGTGIGTIDIDFISSYTLWINDKKEKTSENNDLDF